jgi:hypothetical protein
MVRSKIIQPGPSSRTFLPRVCAQSGRKGKLPYKPCSQLACSWIFLRYAEPISMNNECWRKKQICTTRTLSAFRYPGDSDAWMEEGSNHHDQQSCFAPHVAARVPSIQEIFYEEMEREQLRPAFETANLSNQADRRSSHQA